MGSTFSAPSKCTQFLKALVVVVSLGAIATIWFFNSPVAIVSKKMAVALADETDGVSNKFGTAQNVVLTVQINSKTKISISQFEAYHIKKGDRVWVNVWQRRFFGYVTNYEPVSGG